MFSKKKKGVCVCVCVGRGGGGGGGRWGVGGEESSLLYEMQSANHSPLYHIDQCTGHVS